MFEYLNPFKWIKVKKVRWIKNLKIFELYIDFLKFSFFYDFKIGKENENDDPLSLPLDSTQISPP